MNITRNLLLSAIGICAFSATAQAADGCKFVLCMGAANPMGIAECAPTVREVLRDLKKGKALPTCKLSDGKAAYVTAKPAPVNPECPKGWKQLPDFKGKKGASWYVQGKPTEYTLKTNQVPHRFGAGSDGRVGMNKFDYEIVDGKTIFDGTYKYITCARGETYYSFTDKYNRTYTFVEETKKVNKNEGGFDFTMFVNGQPQQTHRFK